MSPTAFVCTALAGQLQSVDEWMRDWKLDAAKEANLLLLLALVCDANGQL